MGTFKSYHAALAEGQKMANQTGLDVGLEYWPYDKTYTLRYLPCEAKSFGCDANCQRIYPSRKVISD